MNWKRLIYTIVEATDEFNLFLVLFAMNFYDIGI